MYINYTASSYVLIHFIILLILVWCRKCGVWLFGGVVVVVVLLMVYAVVLFLLFCCFHCCFLIYIAQLLLGLCFAVYIKVTFFLSAQGQKIRGNINKKKKEPAICCSYVKLSEEGPSVTPQPHRRRLTLGSHSPQIPPLPAHSYNPTKKQWNQKSQQTPFCQPLNPIVGGSL